MKSSDYAYVAGVIDSLAILRTRNAGGTLLPMVAVHTPQVEVLDYLAEITGTRVTRTARKYSKTACSEHCPDQHQHIESVSGRWSVTGYKATALLEAVLPYLRIKQGLATELIETGKNAPTKPATKAKMAALGWSVSA